MGTTYAYDFPELFRQAIRILWNHASYLNIVLAMFWKPKNLVPDGNNNLQEVANSGARIGLTEEETYKQLYQNGRKFVIAEEIVEEGETRHKITYIIGSKDGLVTCRSVGIGAYLVRLGQRTQIMLKNGVSHRTAQNDLEGITKVMQWFSYVTVVQNNLVPIFINLGAWDNDVVICLPKGLTVQDGFVETLSGWSRTVVVGLARFCGIPMGVIAVGTRTVESIVPADPTAQAINDFNKGGQLPLVIFVNFQVDNGTCFKDSKIWILYRGCTYRQADSIQFADLHDIPGRIKSKETIRKSLEWKESRRFFYWRVRRRLHDNTIESNNNDFYWEKSDD
ncbi:16245_t:CDS:2 [Funneliformis geosporum]|nr:16245_t:CDS:2 [Funneliformis geosporum]